MIGVSLSPKYVLDGVGMETSPEVLLEQLKCKGVSSVELRNARPGADPKRVLAFARKVWDHDLRLTVHCRVNSPETAVSDVFDTVILALRYLRQESLIVTIHPIDGDNVQMLCRLADYAEANRLPVVIALENNRLMPDGSEGDSTELVRQAVEAADRANVGICFDMGHYLYYWKRNHPDEPFCLPAKGFLKRIVHTHIHGVKGLRTHFPVDQFELPLGEILNAMCVAYYGVYNLELDFPRFQELRQPEDGLFGSVTALQAAMPSRALLYDEIRRSYDRDFLQACSVLRQPGTRVALTQCASYLFTTNGFPWAMDVSFLNVLWKLTKSPYRADVLLKDLKLMLLTHEHSDHFNKRTIKCLAQNRDMTWIMPAFLVEKALEQGVAQEKILVARPGEAIDFGPLHILPFEGRHMRPSGKGVPCMGYHISAENAPSLVFPVDVRDYSTDGLPALPPADYCFAHVWLGDGNESAEEFPMAEAFARFMLAFSKKNILLSHLYNAERKLGYMWDRRHAAILEEKIREISPDTEVQIPRIGQILPL